MSWPKHPRVVVGHSGVSLATYKLTRVRNGVREPCGTAEVCRSIAHIQCGSVVRKRFSCTGCEFSVTQKLLHWARLGSTRPSMERTTSVTATPAACRRAPGASPTVKAPENPSRKSAQACRLVTSFSGAWTCDIRDARPMLMATCVYQRAMARRRGICSAMPC